MKNVGLLIGRHATYVTLRDMGLNLKYPGTSGREDGSVSTIRIGDYEIEKVVELERPFAHAQDFFPDLTAEMLDTCRRELPEGRLAANGFLLMSYHCFVVRQGGRTILVDTCCGNGKTRPTRPEFSLLDTDFMGRLASAGVTPEQVNFVMCTHLHWDHVGWNTRLLDGRWVPTFPNAKYIVSRTEFDYWDAAYARGMDSVHCLSFEDSVLPIKKAKQVVVVEDDHRFDDGLSFEPCHGHSPGHVVVNVDSQGAAGALVGDVIHHPVQLRFPTMSTKADTDRDQARQTRTALLEKLAGSGRLMLPAHFTDPTVGRIGTAAAGFRYDPVA